MEVNFIRIGFNFILLGTFLNLLFNEVTLDCAETKNNLNRNATIENEYRDENK